VECECQARGCHVVSRAQPNPVHWDGGTWKSRRPDHKPLGNAGAQLGPRGGAQQAALRLSPALGRKQPESPQQGKGGEGVGVTLSRCDKGKTVA
jgi:hypothetical protein